MRPLRWCAEFAPLCGDRVKVLSENLGVTLVVSVAPVDTSMKGLTDLPKPGWEFAHPFPTTLIKQLQSQNALVKSAWMTDDTEFKSKYDSNNNSRFYFEIHLSKNLAKT